MSDQRAEETKACGPTTDEETTEGNTTANTTQDTSLPLTMFGIDFVGEDDEEKAAATAPQEKAKLLDLWVEWSTMTNTMNAANAHQTEMLQNISKLMAENKEPAWMTHIAEQSRARDRLMLEQIRMINSKLDHNIACTQMKLAQSKTKAGDDGPSAKKAKKEPEADLGQEDPWTVQESEPEGKKIATGQAEPGLVNPWKIPKKQATRPTKPIKSCLFCRGSHKDHECDTFTSAAARMTKLKRESTCPRCGGHRWEGMCNRKEPSCGKCMQAHMTALCGTAYP